MHAISPVQVEKDRDLYYAQPVTFESFRIAKDFAIPALNINQCTVQYQEDRDIVPDYITVLDDITESIQDIGDFAFKYPFIKELLDVVYKNSAGFEYIIWGNPDISLMPFFYNTIFEYIREGHDAIIVNRRSIHDKYKSVDKISLMYAEAGVKHPGWDCFIFKRGLYPKFILKQGILGAVGSGRIIHSNLMFNAENFIELKNSHLTFHLGFSSTTTRQYSDKSWIKSNLHNDEQLKMILKEMISSSNGKDMTWAQKRLEDIQLRHRKYIEGLYGAKRFPGYWYLKKIRHFFNRERIC